MAFFSRNWFFASSLIISTAFASSASAEPPTEIYTPNPLVLNCEKPRGHHLFVAQITCPLGGEAFSTLRLGIHSTFGHYLDGAPASYMTFPPPLPVCPSNGFVMQQSDYSDDDISEISRVIETEDYKKLYAEKHASYYLATIIDEALGLENEKRWEKLVTATWEAHNCGDKEKYALYVSKAIAAIKAQLPETPSGGFTHWFMRIIIAELYRRTGDFQNAEKHLPALDNLPEAPQERDNISLMISLLRKAIEDKDTAPVLVKPENSR